MLRLGTAAESVTVTADASLVEVGEIAQGEVLNELAVRSLPITSRNVYNLHLLGPGVKGIPSTGFGTTQFTFGGHNRTTWTVDGLDNTQRRFNRQIRLVISTPEAVQEMQVLSGAYSAEFGRAAGGVINVVSRSGSNDLHASLMGLYRPNRTSARAPLAARRARQSWWMAAGNLSGPLVKDKLFFFINDEYNPLRLPQPVTIDPDAARALRLSAQDLADSPFGETFHTPSGKLNFNLNSKNSGFLRYNRFTNDQPGGGGGLTAITRSLTFEDRMNGGAAQLATVVSPSLLNELRFGVNRRSEIRRPYVPGQPDGAHVNITGVANFGVNPLAGSSSVETSTQIIDNLTFTRGRHTLKAGLDYQTTGYQITNALTRVFIFGGLPATPQRPAVTPLDQYLRTVAGEIDPATGRPYTYTQLQQQLGENSIALRYHFVNLFAQDEFRVLPRLTFNFGLRYELMLNPTLDDRAPYPLSRRVNNDTNNLAPRFGFSWAPWKDQKTLLKGGYGLFYDSPSLNTSATAALVNGRRILSYTVPGSDPRAPRYPNLLATGDANFQTPPDITAFTPDFKVMVAHNASLQIEREILRDLAVNLQYSYWGHRFAPYSRDINLSAPAGTLADGRPIFRGTAGRPDPRFRAINLIESGANSNYNGFDLTITKRFSRGLQMSTTWSWSHAIAEGDLEAGPLSDPANRRHDRGNANADVRHNWILQGLWVPSFRFAGLKWVNGFEFSSIVFFNSGYPVNAVAGQDLNQDLVLNDRLPFRTRNAFQGPSFLQIDFRLVRRIRFADKHSLELISEAENLTNRLNAACSIAGCTGAVVNRDGAPDFGRITSTRPGRNFQFGMRYSF
ncbi:MAG: TonB-dependent receptor plug domain-containing protein [Bryobacteraceae bacterium]|nr:TonB-dependent receptor plug domain-containing protein [Bryobacteraceae bacterium]MDW8377733.1 TonB-dependent receptor plug domain-containing protein [Bryobacterales bacterium]